MGNIARKTLFFVVTVATVWILRGVWDWNPDLRDRIGDHPWQSVALLTLGVASFALLIWAAATASWWKVILAFVLGIAAALWGSELLEGIAWTQIGIIVACIALLVLLWGLTVLDFSNLHDAVRRFRDGQHAAVPPRHQATVRHPHRPMTPPPPAPGRQTVAPPPPPGTVDATVS